MRIHPVDMRTPHLAGERALRAQTYAPPSLEACVPYTHGCAPPTSQACVPYPCRPVRPPSSQACTPYPADVCIPLLAGVRVLPRWHVRPPTTVYAPPKACAPSPHGCASPADVRALPPQACAPSPPPCAAPRKRARPARSCAPPPP
jgi:hypothetical protein